MKKIVFHFLISVLMLGLMFNIEGSASATGISNFKDVPSTYWAKEAIDSAVTKGYFKGYADGTFKPNATVTRAEFAALMARVSINTTVDGRGSFKDLSGHWSESEVNQSIGKGFINPADYSNGFQPNTPLTRAEMAKWMSSGLAAKDSDYEKALADTKDTLVPVAEYYKGGLDKSDYPYVSVALGTSLMGGYPDGTFGVNKTTTRAEVATIILRYEKIQTSSASSFKDLNELREVGLTGTNVISIGKFVYAKDRTTGEVQSFSNVRDIPFNLRNNIAEVKIHRMILVDATSSGTPKHLYGKMFVDKNFSYLEEFSDSYTVFMEFTVTPKVDKVSSTNYSNASNDPFIAVMPFNSGTISKYGLTSLPFGQDYADVGFFKKGVTKTFWGVTSVYKDYQSELTDNGGGITVKGKSVSFFVPKDR